MTRNGALAGMLVGALTVIVWKQFGWLGLYEIIPGFLFSGLAIVVFSLLDKAPPRPCWSASTTPSASSRPRRMRWVSRLPSTELATADNKSSAMRAFTRTSDRSVSKTL